MPLPDTPRELSHKLVRDGDECPETGELMSLVIFGVDVTPAGEEGDGVVEKLRDDLRAAVQRFLESKDECRRM